MGGLDIRIDGADEPIYRPHRDSFSSGGKQSINFESLSFVEIPGVDDDIAAVAWVLHHEYEGAVPSGTLVKGLRLRTGDIQVGDHVLLEDLFPEPRFNGWSVGEVHVIDRRVVPNGRRDHFEQNIHFYNLVNHLTPTARDIARRCRTSSVRRKWEREFELYAQSATEAISILVQGSVSQRKRKQLALSVEQTLLQMGQIAGKELRAKTPNDREDRIDALREQLSKAMNDDVVVSSLLMRLPKTQRKMYERFFDLVYECSVNRTVAKTLIDRILLKLE